MKWGCLSGRHLQPFTNAITSTVRQVYYALSDDTPQSTINTNENAAMKKR